MKTLEDVIVRLDIMESLAYSVEGYINEMAAEGASATARRAQSLFCLLMEQISTAQEEANEVDGHIKVCNAVYAVNRVEELRAEIERLKGTEQ